LTIVDCQRLPAQLAQRSFDVLMLTTICLTWMALMY
jgi:hypothetical protein